MDNYDRYVEEKFKRHNESIENISKRLDDVSKKLEQFIEVDFHKMHLEMLKTITTLQYKLGVVITVGVFVLNKYIF